MTEIKATSTEALQGRFKNFLRLKGTIEGLFGPIPDDGWSVDQWEAGLEVLLAEVRQEGRRLHHQ